MNNRALYLFFLISCLGHIVFLCGIPGIKADSPHHIQPEIIKVQLSIEKEEILPDIDKLGVEKKLKEIKNVTIHDEKDIPINEDIHHIQNKIQKEKKKIKIASHLKEITPPPEIKSQVNDNPVVRSWEVVNQKIQSPRPEIVLKPQDSSSNNVPVKKHNFLNENKQLITSNTDKEIMLRYQDMIRQKIQAVRKYPRWAQKQGWEGYTDVGFTVLANGSITDVKILRSSGRDIFEKEAVSNIKRAAPFPPIPPSSHVSKSQMEVRIVFELN